MYEFASLQLVNMNAPSAWHQHEPTNQSNSISRTISESPSPPSRISSEEAMNLKVAQTEALREAPDTSSTPLYHYHHGEASDVFRNNSAPLVPLVKATSPSLRNFDTRIKKRAYTSALYYSECFLNGITPKEADKAAQQTRGQYQKWWVRATAGAALDENSSPIPVGGDTRPPRSDGSFNKRKHGVVISDDGSSVSSHSGSKRQRRRRRGEVRDLIDELPRVRRRSLSSTSTCSSTLIPPDAGTSNDATEHQHFTIQSIPNLSGVTASEIEDVREAFIEELVANGGDASTPRAKQSLDLLESYYASSSGAANDFPTSSQNIGPHSLPSPSSACELEGTWLTLTKPTYTGCHGLNIGQDPVYSLGQMSFDMFRPTSLRCSIQGTFNTVHRVEKEDIMGASGNDVTNVLTIPRSLRKEIQQSLEDGSAELRTYNIVVAFTIEPGQTVAQRGGKQSTKVRRPIRGILSNYGYAVPDPNVPDRYSIWFTGGSIEVSDEERDMDGWRAVFDQAPNRDMMEYARVLAAKVLLGAEVADTMSPNGTMTYSLRRPIGGHGSAYCDILYLDHKLRIMRGHHGSIYCFAKIPEQDDVKSISR